MGSDARSDPTLLRGEPVTVVSVTCADWLFGSYAPINDYGRKPTKNSYPHGNCSFPNLFLP